MHLACCQFAIRFEDKPANYARVESLLRAADLPPATLLLLPEMFATGFTMNAVAVAEDLGGPTSQFLSGLARQSKLYIQAGVVLRTRSDARPTNEALVFDPDGRLVARYAKIHLFSFASENAHYTPGEQPTLFPWQTATIAPAICYDLRFPELFRRVVGQGADLLTLIACWPAARHQHWLTLAHARAIENQCHLAAVNRCGGDPSGLTYGGGSRILGPRGEILAEADDRDAVIDAEIDLADQRRYRAEFPALADRHY